MTTEKATLERWFEPTGKVRGVALVTHGMNLRPDRMDDLARLFAEEGFATYRGAFAGHGPNNKEYLDVEAAHWEADARRLHGIIAARAKELGVPTLLGAYSFSGAVFHALAEELPFQRRIYLAPALALKFWYPAIQWFARAFPKFTYASLNLPEYRSQDRSGTRPFVALDYFVRKLRKGAARWDRAPTLILVDPKDELISYPGLMRLADERPNWRVERVSVEGCELSRGAHHLIVDPPCVGAKEWGRVSDLVRAFLAK